MVPFTELKAAAEHSEGAVLQEGPSRHDLTVHALVKDPSQIFTLKPEKEKWFFGVRATETTRGCRVDSVIAHSPASRAGLEVGDYIIAFNGRQIGIVRGTIYSLASEIRHSSQLATASIWDWRRKIVVDRDVELEEN